MKTISVIDSHTGGEPTRIIVEGGPELGQGPLSERAAVFADQFDEIRSAVISEPRGSDILVGGVLCQPKDLANIAGVIYFDNAGLLGMCGHGTIGLCVTLHYLGKMPLGCHRVETPVGIVDVELIDTNRAKVKNVVSYRTQKNVELKVPGHGKVIGDIAWGGNWFFLTEDTPCSICSSNTDQLLMYTKAVRHTLLDQGYTGDNGELINHVEIHGPPVISGASAKNFVLCPGGSYDRSPCGTGTSAKLACLAADGKLKPGEAWHQESIVGSVFETRYQQVDQGIIPEITGTAYISGDCRLILDPADPFRHGITA